MRSTLYLPLLVPFLVLIWAFSVAGVGISASIVARDDSEFPGHLGQYTKALLATFCLATFSTMAILLGLLVVPRIAASWLLNAIIWGIVWIMALVGASGLVVALANNSCSRIRCNAFGRRCVRVSCSQFHSQEAMAWIVCWMSFFLLIVAIVSSVTRKPRKESPRSVQPIPPVQGQQAPVVKPEQYQAPQNATMAV